MRTMAALAALLVCAASQAQTVDICDRTPQVRRAILRALDADYCDAVASARLARIETLFMESHGLTALRVGDFEGLDGLVKLHLTGNRLTALPGGVFDGLDSLENLYLSANQLTALPDGAFDGLTSLQRLDLHHNRLTSLPEGAFDELTGLRSLGLSGNQFATLSPRVFDELSRLELLSLSENRLTTLPDGIFEGLDGLGRLWLEGNQLTTLPNGVFNGLSSLNWLNLTGNRLTTLPSGVFNGLSSLVALDLQENRLTTLPDGVFDGLTSLVRLSLQENQLTTLPSGVFDSLTSLQRLLLNGNRLTSLPAGAFDGLTSLQRLWLNGNRLTSLPAGVFDGLTSLNSLYLQENRLTTLPDGVFDGLASLQHLNLSDNHLVGLTRDAPLFAELSGVDVLLDRQSGAFVDICDRTPQVRDAITDDCAAVGIAKWVAAIKTLNLGSKGLKALRPGDFEGLFSLQTLDLHGNRLTTLPAGVFDGLDSLQTLSLGGNRLTTLPEDVFEGLSSLQTLSLHGNQLTTLPPGVFEGLSSLEYLDLGENRLATLPDGIFDGLASLRRLFLWFNLLVRLPPGVFDELDRLGELYLSYNRLKTLPEGLFDELDILWNLRLSHNHLAGLTRDDPLFDGLRRGERWGDFRLGYQSSPYLPAAVPLMLSASNHGKQGFVRIVNEGDESGSVSVFAVDDGGHAPDPIEIRLGAGQVVHFNSDDLEDGNPNKGIESGVGNPVEGDWRLDVATALPVRVMSFVRHADGFLTAMHDVLPSLAAHTFNPGRNANQASSLRLVNGWNDANVSIEGVDDTGNTAGPVTLPATGWRNESRTLSAVDLESGANGLTGTLGEGAGKWRLFIDAGREVVGMSLLESASGHLTNISTMGVAIENDRVAAAVPLMLSAADSTRRGFVRVVNESNQSGVFRVFAFDDRGHAPDPIEIRLGAGQVVHFNSNDLEDGNAGKGIEGGVGGPVQGDWRLNVETDMAVRVLAFVRHRDGFLTAMHDVLPRDADGRLAAHTFNPGGNMNQASKLRLVNTGANDEDVSIEGVDDQGGNAGPVTLTLPAGESRTLSAFDLENGARGLAGTLGDGAGKWRLLITAGSSVVGMSLLESASGQLTNISTAGVAGDGQ